MTSLPRVAVLGMGIGGTQVAAYLGLRGVRLSVHDIRDEALAAVRDAGGVNVTGVTTGFAPVERATLDVEEALTDANVILVATLHNNYRAVASSLAPLLRDGHAICLMPGYVGGAAEFLHTLSSLSCQAEVAVAEMDSFPFTGGVAEPGHLHLTSVKRRLQVSSIPGKRLPEVVGSLRLLFPMVIPAENVLYTSFSSMNPVLHVPGMLANAARLDAGQAFDFYGDGISPSVARLSLALDGERLAVSDAYGVKLPTVTGWLTDTYGIQQEDLYDGIQVLHRDIFGNSPAPAALDNRYVTEDVPFGLVPLAELGRAASVATPVADALTTQASVMLGHDFRAEGRTLDKMGLAGLSVGDIRAKLEAA